ncbi:endoplasmic reticulum membrane sensor NFE2L1-like [Parambassis ranga]|uniref:Endoplasmic reticulum membrane sensor NFE2L1 n=1 Tax=Parambassis ranga TaxID=210632 RepID=A0A6P7IQ51_9TELE|nr:endoplasmic reticulum membrane sensor NFE2L1-like [Parambassis ranga]
MLYLKKYFTEGLIQMAILLSLCGVRVDVGLEPYLPPSWHEMILGPTSALTQTQFHNLRNRLEEGHSLHPKSVDLDGFFTARRLLGWVRSLDRLQVPHAELETWLVQREPDLPNQLSLVERAASGDEQDRTALPVELRAGLEEEEEDEGGMHHSGALDDRGEEDLTNIQRHRNTEDRGTPGGSCGDLPQSEEDETSLSLQECLRLLEDTFPLTQEQQLSGVECRREDLLSDREPPLSPIIPTDNPSLEMELHWQDLLAIMEPEGTTSFDHTLQSRPSGTFGGFGSETHPLGRFGSQSQSELEPALLPLTPSAELDEHSSTLNTRATSVDCLDCPSDHTDRLAEDASRDTRMELNAEDSLNTFNMNLLTQAVDGIEPENHPGFDANLCSHNSTPPSFTPSLEQNGITQDLLFSSSGVFLTDEDDLGDEDGFPSPLDDLLEDAAILDEMSLLDMALEEGFSPEMAARLEEEGYFHRETAQQGTGKDNVHLGSNMTENQDQQGRHQQDGEDEEDSDSGLSLAFSHSPASPCASEASSYSSSSSSTSSSSCVSAVGSPFSEDDENEEGLFASDMEVEVTIKQEELDEEEMGAVGGGYPRDAEKLFPYNYGDRKLFHGFPWLEHVGHDHTYNQPWASTPSPTLGKMPTKHTKASPRHDHSKPYHRSSTRHIPPNMWTRDERRAQTLKIPFSNELIINLPVEEFNDLLTNYKFNEEQLTLIRDIRRRGKNKIAAQNCRKRKLDVLLTLEDDLTGLRRHRSRLLREKQEAMRNLQEMKRRLDMLYQEVFSRLRDEEGRPLDAVDYLLNFEPNGSVTVASRQQGTDSKNSKKQKDKKK